MDDSHHQYGITDLRQLMNLSGGGGGGGGRLTSPSPPSSSSQMNNIPSDLFGFNLALGHHQYHHQEMNFVTRGDSGLQGLYTPLAPDSSNINGNGVGCFGGLLDGGDGNGGGTGRWPRQETLMLLEIRSRLDHKFKEANQKGPLWDEVSRILSEEHGYHRSGKKCREKFENLYKYYKKTKEGKAGRQDGKHYRFFRQLEALYGDSSNPVSRPEAQFIGNGFHFQAPTSNNIDIVLEANNSNQVEALNNLNQKLSMEDHSLSLSNIYCNSTEFDSSSSDENQTIDSITKRTRRRNWKAKIKVFIDSQMKKLMERQEAWLEKLTKTIEEKEQDRMMREELWRKQESMRVEKERKFWAKEKEWMESREANLVEALQNLTGRRLLTKLSSNNSSEQEEMINNVNNENVSDDQTAANHYLRIKADGTPWTESEIARLIELRTSMEPRFQQALISGCSEEVLWEEISTNMCFLGNEPREALVCKEKWEFISNYVRIKNKEPDKKRSREYSIPRRITDSENGYDCDQIDDLKPFHGNNNNNNEGSSTSNSNIGNNGGFPFMLGDGNF